MSTLPAHLRRGAQRRTHRGRGAPAGARSLEDETAQTMLALQHAAGNVALARLLTRSVDRPRIARQTAGATKAPPERKKRPPDNTLTIPGVVESGSFESIQVDGRKVHLTFRVDRSTFLPELQRWVVEARPAVETAEVRVKGASLMLTDPVGASFSISGEYCSLTLDARDLKYVSDTDEEKPVAP